MSPDKYDMRCQSAAKMLIAYQRSELAQAAQEQIEGHLAVCEECRRELRLVRQAYQEIVALPVYPAPDNLHNMAEEARRRSQLASGWRRYYPLPLTAGTILLLFSLLCCRLLPGPANNSSVAALPVHHADRTLRQEMAMIPSVPHALQKLAVHRKLAPWLASSHSFARDKGKYGKRNDPRQRTLLASQGVADNRAKARVSTFPLRGRHPSVQLSACRDQFPVIDNDLTSQGLEQTLLVRHVDVLAQYMAQAASSQETVTCAVFPVVTERESDYPVADTLTAILQYELHRQMPQATISRQAPLLSFTQFAGGIGPETPEIMRIAMAGSSSFVVTGSVTKSKAGYLFSVYVVDVRSNKLLVNGAHPLLLRGELLASSQKPSGNSPEGEI